jgi:hypothetical protein
MQALGFDNYAGVMKVYLSKYRVVSLLSYAHLAISPPLARGVVPAGIDASFGY